MTNRELFRVSKKRLCELTSQYYEPLTLKEVAYEKVSKHFGYFLFFMNQNQHEVKVYFDRYRDTNILRIECRQEAFEKMYHPSDQELLTLGLIRKEKYEQLCDVHKGERKCTTGEKNKKKKLQQ